MYSLTFIFFPERADPHIDLYYKEGSDPFNQDFGDIGCRIKSSKQKDFAGKYGTPFANCDIPMITFHEVLEFISSYEDEESSMILFLGDIPGHDIKNQTKEDNLKVIRIAYELLNEYFGEHCSVRDECSKIVLPTLGNHDTFPIEQLCPPDYPLFNECGKFLLDLYGEMASKWIPSKVDGIKNHAYYSYVLPGSKLKFISLQTQWESIDNLYNYLKKTSMITMIDWLQLELEKSKASDEKVIIFGHIPTDSDEPSPFQKLFPTWQNGFLDLVSEYHDIIIASFFGHDHTDRFYVQKDSENHTILTNFVCPSVVTGTPNLHHGGREYETNNPTVRLVKYETDSSHLIDVITFVNDLKQSNLDGSMEKNWRKEYTFVEDYGMKDLSNSEFDGLISRMKEDEELFQKYCYFHHSSISNATCKGDEEKKQICMIQNSYVEKYDLCMN